ncbi:hypothetical protein OROGR_002359 [Orobanche gracilis]
MRISTTLPQFLTAQARNTQDAFCAGFFFHSVVVLCYLLSLRLIVTASASIKHIDLIECRRRGIDVANTANVFFVDVSNLAVGLLLNVLRKISAENLYVGNRLWHKQGSYPLGYTA